MLEDESGRLQLDGKHLLSLALCTGCIVAMIGTENANGAFEVIDVKFPDLPPQPERWTLTDSILKAKRDRQTRGKVAIVSGLEINGVSGDTMALELLAEYLLGEAGDAEESAPISRLIIAGNSLSDASPIPTREELARKKSTKKYGTDPSAWNATPAQQLDQFLSTLLPSLPITLIPGASDPANVSVPQLPLHSALFPHSRAYTKRPGDDSPKPSWFDSATNPWEGEVDGWRILGTGGQPINDMFRYAEGDDRLQMMENFLRWRNVAPTAPDTLCE
jgi:DNA polymerase delta subunit 2